MILTHLVLFSFLGGAGAAAVAPPVIVIQQGHGSRKTWREVVTAKKKYEPVIPALVFKPAPKPVRIYFEDIPWPITAERRKADRRQKRLDILSKLVDQQRRRKRAVIAALVMEIYGT